MKKIVSICFILNILYVHILTAQQKTFNVVTTAREITGVAQDRQGYIWYGSANDGLFRYDGSKVVSFTNNPQNPNSLASNKVFSIVIDTENIVWIGTSGGGLDRYDPITNTFTHFRHNSKDKGSLSNDTVYTILQDKAGNLWVGTYGGLDLFNSKTGGFTHYANNPADPTSLSHNHVWTLYEDRQGTLWVGCGSPYADRDKEKTEEGGLNRLDKQTGKFTRYLHDSAKPYSIANNKIRAIFEDSKNNFWVGTAGDGLHTLDRGSGKFTHYYYNPSNPESLSRPPVYHVRDSITLDIITFIHEDARGFIWIGTLQSGINQYNPATKKMIHHGYLYEKDKRIATDTLSGFKDGIAWGAFASKDGLLWIAASEGVYSVNPFPTPVIPHITLKEGRGNAFYEEENGTFWIGTNSGLIRNDKKTGTQKKFSHDPNNLNSLSHNNICAIEADSDGKFWIPTDGGGLNKFDPLTQTFTRYLHDTKKGSLSSNRAFKLYFDRNKDLWVSTWDSGLNKLDSETGFFTSYQHDNKDSTSLSHNRVNNMVDDSTGDLWVATNSGLNRLNKKNGKFKRYLINTRVNSIWVDKKNIIWIGAVDGLYRYDRTNDRFLLYTVNDGWPKIDKVLNIIEDDQKSLWVRNTNALYRISENRSEVRIYGSEQGMQKSPWGFTNSYKTKAGKIFIAEQDGYYTFLPEQITGSSYPPQINITSFQLGSVEVKPGEGSVLKEPVYQAKEISLGHNQNSFSIGFWAIHYTSPGEEHYQYMLENYDNVWHDAGDERKAYFFNVPPGHYTFRVRAMNSDGVWSEKKLPIIVHPPWWQTPWATTLFIVCFIAIVWAFAYYRSRSLRKENLFLEEKVNQRTAQLKQSLEELKSTQTQLIHSEKMASLGELTAGIAHEIQNPLNFVNNFSEVNQEMVDEATEEIDKGNIEEVKNILSDIKDNSEKINHHGKRADAIVKGMLQHSRSSSGVKEPTDINKLADEYLRLAYHGLRAKDKSFNATMKTDFDEAIGNINIIPQDIGRVILNLINNAFYAVDERRKQQPTGYEPTISVTTKKILDKSKSYRIEIKVADNGNGIPKKVLDKIFQPFFTTKPTGEGTGLGLSLSYDIVKAHGGEIKVETKEGAGSEFIIQLPV